MIVEYGDVRISDERIEGLDGGHPVIRISRVEIQSICLCWGQQAARPFLQIALGLGSISIGILAIIHLILSFLRSEAVYGKLDIWLTTLILLGGWLLRNALKRGYYLGVSTRRGTREKVPFNKHATIMEIHEFLGQASTKLGYIFSIEAGAHRVGLGEVR